MKMKANTILISVALTILLVLVAALAFIVYQSRAYKVEAVEFQRAARSADALAASQTTLKRNLRDAQGSIDALNARFVRQEDVSSFIDTLERVAASEGVSASVGSINLDAAAGPGGLTSLRMRIDGGGAWTKVVGFIAALESLPYALRVETMEVAKASAGDAGDSWRFIVDLRQYISK